MSTPVPVPTPPDVATAVEVPGTDWVAGVIFIGIVLMLVTLRFWTSDPRTMSLTKAVVSLLTLAALVVAGTMFGRTGLLLVVVATLVATAVFWRTRARRNKDAPPDIGTDPDRDENRRRSRAERTFEPRDDGERR